MGTSLSTNFCAQHGIRPKTTVTAKQVEDLWSEYDSDKLGYLETAQARRFLSDLFAAVKMPSSTKAINQLLDQYSTADDSRFNFHAFRKCFFHAALFNTVNLSESLRLTSLSASDIDIELPDDSDPSSSSSFDVSLVPPVPTHPAPPPPSSSSSSSSSSSEAPKPLAMLVELPEVPDDFVCPICMDVFERPVKLKKCSHIFCCACFEDTLVHGINCCPLCRTDLLSPSSSSSASSSETSSSSSSSSSGSDTPPPPPSASAIKRMYRVDNEMQQRLETTDIECVCKSKVLLTKWKAHQLSCAKVQSKFQTLVERMETGVKKIQSEIAAGSTAIQEAAQAASSTVNRATFNCPVCYTVKHLTLEALTKHLDAEKKKHSKKALCPVCVSMPWGDPSHQVANFYDHYIQRHKFDYSTFVDYQQDEDEMFQLALQQSLNT